MQVILQRGGGICVYWIHAQDSLMFTIFSFIELVCLFKCLIILLSDKEKQ